MYLTPVVTFSERRQGPLKLLREHIPRQFVIQKTPLCTRRNELHGPMIHSAKIGI
jgi:hypothetical protein